MKYMELPIPELYSLNADPAELKNLASSEPARVEALRSRLQQLRGPRAAVAAGPRVAPRRASGCRALDTSLAIGPAHAPPSPRRTTRSA